VLSSTLFVFTFYWFKLRQVLLAIKEKHDEFMLSSFFNYLDRYFITWRSLTPLRDVGLIYLLHRLGKLPFSEVPTLVQCILLSFFFVLISQLMVTDISIKR
jgi:hypothetical protein